MKTLILLRGLPGSGKSTVASWLEDYLCYGDTCQDGFREISLDEYFTEEDGTYHYDVEKVQDAVRWCHHECDDAMEAETEVIVVHNVMSRSQEFNGYHTRARKHGYRIHSLIVENRHGGRDVHDVPKESLKRFRDRFQVQL